VGPGARTEHHVVPVLDCHTGPVALDKSEGCIKDRGSCAVSKHRFPHPCQYEGDDEELDEPETQRHLKRSSMACGT